MLLTACGNDEINTEEEDSNTNNEIDEVVEDELDETTEDYNRSGDDLEFLIDF